MSPLESVAVAGESGHELKGKTLLVISSGAPTKKFLFQRLKALGLRLVVLSPEETWAARYADTILTGNTIDHQDCIQRVEEWITKDAGAIDGVLTFWEEAVPLCAAISERFELKGHSLKSALNARNKILTRKALEAAGLKKYSPAWAQIKSVRDLEREARRIDFPLVLKPAWGVESQFVVRSENMEEAINAFEYLKSNLSPGFNSIYSYGTEIIVEAYLPGAEVDVDLLVQEGQIKFHAFTDNFPTKEPFFIETGDAMPSRHEASDLTAVLTMAQEAVGALGLGHGAVHLEAKIGPEGSKLIEVNARMGGDYLYDWIKTIWDVDMVEEAARLAVGAPCQPRKLAEAKVHLVGKYLVSESSGVVSGLHVPDEKNLYGIHDITFLKEPGDPVLVPPEGFDSLGWVVGKGHTYAEAEENLNETLRRITINVARFDAASSLGKTRRRNRFDAAHVARRRIIESARLEKIRGFDLKASKKLHVGILCNKYEGGGASNGESEAKVHEDLTSVGLNIQMAVEAKGHHVTFFDMNESPLPFNKIAEANVDLVFNVCERINNSSLLEPHAAAILDSLGIPYTGSNPLTLALCIDKIKIKKILEYHKLPTPKFDYVFQKDEEIRDDLRFPLMVKLANTDNSIGISNDSVVTSPRQLREQVERLINNYRRPVLIEEYIEGDEVDVSIIGNEDRVKVLPLSRSIFDDLPEGVWHIYPFKAKWAATSVYDKIRVERPAKYSQKLTALISEICLDAYNIFDCHDYARVEVRVDKQGNPYILEINPNPSINRGDCVPNCAEMIGQSYEDFIEEILKEAILRYRERPPYYHLQSMISPLG
ncbi:MAG: ATP-grasp domain-containing protein [Elusimicrobia bacterium]|nr:ATP-grasp domain-containing protein [Elusimicrobiota bacterium]